MTFGRLQWIDKAQHNSSLPQALLQHTRDWALQLRQGVENASPGFQGSEFWVWDFEVMSLGSFSTEYGTEPGTLCLCQCILLWIDLQASLWQGQRALVEEQWTEVPGTLLTSSSTIVVLSLKNIRGLFENFDSSREEASDHCWGFRVCFSVLVCFFVKFFFSGISILKNIFREFCSKDSYSLNTENYGWQNYINPSELFWIKMLKTITNRMNLGKICF